MSFSRTVVQAWSVVAAVAFGTSAVAGCSGENSVVNGGPGNQPGTSNNASGTTSTSSGSSTSMSELQSLIDESRLDPAIDGEAFPATPSEGFWARTPLAGMPDAAWFVSFLEGIAYNAVLTHPYRVRCVR